MIVILAGLLGSVAGLISNCYIRSYKQDDRVSIHNLKGLTWIDWGFVLAFGLLSSMISYSLGASKDTIIACFLLWTGLSIARIDLKWQVIPDRLNLLVFIVGLSNWMTLMWISKSFLLDPVLGSILGGGFLLLIAYLGPMGGGDIKYMFGAGLFLGVIKTVLALYVSFILGGVAALFLILLGRVKKGQHFPFGPYLVLGVLISYLYGSSIIETCFEWLNY